MNIQAIEFEILSKEQVFGLLVIPMLMSLSIWVCVLSYFECVSDWKMALLSARPIIKERKI
jgi:hypothetical protein